jgi:hypothetical protein
MDARDELTEAFDRGFREGLDSLNLRERDLYLIQEFIIAYEMGGLSGFLYNRLPDVTGIGEIVASMRARSLNKLADLLEQAKCIFRDGAWPEGLTTWGSVLQHYDPSRRLDTIESEIESLDDYGLRDLK